MSVIGALVLAIVMLGAMGAQASPVHTLECEVVVAGGGFAGVAASLEALSLNRKVCMTEITDWVGGQVSAQGVSALDEDTLQRKEDLFPAGYLEFRRRVQERYGDANPGKCWVSTLCFSPQSGVAVLEGMLAPYLTRGQLILLKNTVVKDVEVQGNEIRSLLVLTHRARNPERDQNSLPLSHYIEDWYRPEPSELFDKELVRLTPPGDRPNLRVPWMVIDATETGELLPLADVPYRLGSDRKTPWEPGASSAGTDPYCIQNFTYSFAIEQDDDEQTLLKPTNYDSPFNAPAYSFEKSLFRFPVIFTYRRIRGMKKLKVQPIQAGFGDIHPGDQSLMNWTWGNDWRLSTADTNVVLTQAQLEADGQLPRKVLFGFVLPGDWRGGLRTRALADAEDHAFGFYYWLVEGTDDWLLERLDPRYRKPRLSGYGLLHGKDSPMGTSHGLSRYPYFREARRIVGRTSPGYPNGFMIYENDLSGADATALHPGQPRQYYDSVGLGQYRVDIHPCVIDGQFHSSPYEAFGKPPNPRFPYQIPLRALIPQRIDNLLAGSKNIATSHITNAAYRVHPAEWAIGVAAGHTASFAFERQVFPSEMTDSTPRVRQLLEALQRQIQSRGNPIVLPGLENRSIAPGEP